MWRTVRGWISGFLMIIFLLYYQGSVFALELRWAKGFVVEKKDGVTLVSVRRPWVDSAVEFHYLLKKRGEPTPSGYTQWMVVEVPVRRVVALSSTVLGYLDQLGLLDHIVGCSDPTHVYNETILREAAEGRIANVGMGTSLQIEELLALMPGIVFTFATGTFRDSHPKLLEAGLSVGVMAEYMEEHPLGRAEWIKFFGLFFDCEKRAEEIFAETERRYLALASRVAASDKKKPSVITGTPFHGQWYIAGGNSYVGRLLADAGADYLWKETQYTGSKPVDIEVVFARGLDAEFWLNPGVWKSVNQGRDADPRFRQFKALVVGKIFNNNARISKTGANDYWESGVVAPDILLKDLVSIFHPYLLPEHQLFYYTQLPER
ncbi:MAG: ABC transporter substrate-binding protein [Deltaproteobacteria bacterium]|nr:MAG: ABC transporter substrate-binding protein [Deltaproteobacteria bacterium]